MQIHIVLVLLACRQGCLQPGHMECLCHGLALCIMHCCKHSVCAVLIASMVPLAGSNVTSVAEDEVMRILVLIRNYLPARDQIVSGNWDVPAVAVNSWDLIDKTVGTVGGGRIGYHMMKRLRVSPPCLQPPPPTPFSFRAPKPYLCACAHHRAH